MQTDNYLIPKIDATLRAKFKLAGDIETDGYTLLKRLVMFLVAAWWISFYPVYLLLIHMKVEHFFSYDIFVDGIFGVKSFITLVYILIAVSSIYMWGFIILIAKVYKKNNNPWWFWLLVIIGVLSSLAFHYLIYFSGFKTGHSLRIYWVSFLGLILSGAIASYLKNPIKNILTNWIAPFVAIVLSAVLPLIGMQITSDVVKTGLENFKVGGGIKASVIKIDSNKLVIEGALLLVTPNYVYIRVNEDGYVSISRSDNIYLKVDGVAGVTDSLQL